MDINEQLIVESQLNTVIAIINYVFWMCLLQGELNDTIVLQLLDDATPEDKDEYKVSLSNIQTFGNASALCGRSLCMKPKISPNNQYSYTK